MRENNNEAGSSENVVNQRSSFRTESIKRTISKLNSTTSKIWKNNKKLLRRTNMMSYLRNNNNDKLNVNIEVDDEDTQVQNTVSTFDLFKYASLRERMALILGLMCMLYAASWQPISVFILATMASLMGDYSRTSDLLNRLACQPNLTKEFASFANKLISQPEDGTSLSPMRFLNETIGWARVNLSAGGAGSIAANQTTTEAADHQSRLIGQQQPTQKADKSNLELIMRHLIINGEEASDNPSNSILSPSIENSTSNFDEAPFNSIYNSTTIFDWNSSIYQNNNFDNNSQIQTNLPILEPIARLLKSILSWHEIDDLDQQSINNNEDNNMTSTLGQLVDLHERHFLQSSLSINGSAFVLAQTQLLAFFFGISLIAWAARQQASRVKCLFFKSCLRQELNWFESMQGDVAGSGSSLNQLASKYEDGIGIKLALLAYFLGHIILMALVSFYQLANLASFCMPFVLIVWLCIVYLSNLQSVAIGESSMFAKRSLQLAEEIIMSMKTIFAFNGQQKEIERFKGTLEPVYKRSLIKHVYTALNTSISKFSIFACFSLYCFYASRLFPPYDPIGPKNRAIVLAVMRGAEVSIVNILISIPFMEALQQSRGSIARIYQIIERRSRINPTPTHGDEGGGGGDDEPNQNLDCSREQEITIEGKGSLDYSSSTCEKLHWDGSLSFQAVQFSYARRPQLAHFRRVASRRCATGTRAPCTILVSGSPEGGVKSPSSTRRSSNLSKSGKTGEESENGESKPDDFFGADGALGLPRIVRSLSVADRNALLGTQQNILAGVSFQIKSGQSVALVGPSGSGKSTILALVQRLYDITDGQVYIGKHEIRSLPAAWLRNQIGVVTQEPRLFDLSISENIRLGLSREQEAKCDEQGIQQQVIEAAQMAGAHSFISRLPSGYETRVGSGGVQLSGGQKQRIAIARALVRRPKLLLLDECTSALDSESEAQVQAALKAASSRKTTTLTVAHGLASIRYSDLILVMEKGRLVERGTHDQLMAASGLYARLWQEQSMQKQSRPSTSISCCTSSSQQSFDMSDCCSATNSENHNTTTTTDVESTTEARTTTKKKQLSPSELNECLGNASLLIRKPSFRIKNLNSKISTNNTLKTLELAKPDSTRSGSVASIISLSILKPNDQKPVDEQAFNPHFKLTEPTCWQLLRFIEMPKWAALAAALACLLAGLILPLNLIAHSYLFAAFAYDSQQELGGYIYLFGVLILSFSVLVFVISLAQIILPGYVGELLSKRMRSKIIIALLKKPLFYYDLQMNSPGGLCDRFNTHISNIQSIAGSRVATLLEALSCLTASAIFGFWQSSQLSLFCLAFALLVLCTTILESKLMQLECTREQHFDVQAANLMADALSNIKTITSLNGESFFIKRFSDIMAQRKRSHARSLVYLRTFLTSLKFVMPAMSWSASMYYGSLLLVEGKIDLQTVFIVCPVVLFAVNDTFRALVFLPELLKAQKSIKHLYELHEEFSPRILKKLTLAEQLLGQHALVASSANNNIGKQLHTRTTTATTSQSMKELGSSSSSWSKRMTKKQHKHTNNSMNGATALTRSVTTSSHILVNQQAPSSQINNINLLIHNNNNAKDHRRLASLNDLPAYMSRASKVSLLNSIIPRSSARGRLEFTNVAFAYPNRPQQLVLESFSLQIAPGECVALVGNSGSGKSSTVGLLEKFYDYHAGQISLDGQDLRLIESSWVRSQIGLVSQEASLFSCSIADNIRYGDNTRHVPMEELIEAARAANIHDFIMSLPDQYETQLSGASGSQLSGGQRQRIAIARALVRRAPILVLDEATSALDTQNESLVQEALRRSRRGRTCIMIAHRLATIQDADKIVVMRDGHIVELGSHHELLRLDHGHYRKLWERQQERAQDDDIELELEH